LRALRVWGGGFKAPIGAPTSTEVLKTWGEQWDLNPQSTDDQSVALPVELHSPQADREPAAGLVDHKLLALRVLGPVPIYHNIMIRLDSLPSGFRLIYN